MHRIIRTAAVTIKVMELPKIHEVVGGGIEALPLTVFMGKANKTPKWWGLHVLEVRTSHLCLVAAEELEVAIRCALAEMHNNPHSDIKRVVQTLCDHLYGRKRPVLYGGDCKDLLQAMFANGCQIDVYRDPGALARVVEYGGFEGQVEVFGLQRTFFLYHRGVALYNYLNESEAIEVIKHQLKQLFPEVFTQPIVPGIMWRHQRLRGKS